MFSALTEEVAERNAETADSTIAVPFLFLTYAKASLTLTFICNRALAVT